MAHSVTDTNASYFLKKTAKVDGKEKVYQVSIQYERPNRIETYYVLFSKLFLVLDNSSGYGGNLIEVKVVCNLEDLRLKHYFRN